MSFKWAIDAMLRRLLPVIAVAFTPAICRAMEIQWTRMAGQWPVEASPLVGKFSDSGKEEILVLNRGGQLLLWDANGTAIGTGQDGAVGQLPEGRWTTTPTQIESSTGVRFVVASVEGLVIGLNQKFQSVWQRKLSGETSWGRAVPAKVQGRFGPRLVFADVSGAVSCLSPTGEERWTNAPGVGPCKAPPQSFSLKSDEDSVLVPAGSTLLCYDAAGTVRWRRDLGHEISTRPEVLSLADRRLILCGTASGSLFALNMAGKILWTCSTGDTLCNSITFLPRRSAEPLILCACLWGNLHAVDVQGRQVWTHLFRAKYRGAPLVLDTDGDGRHEIFIPTFHQHVYEFDEDGKLKDDIRLSGITPSALVPIAGSSGRPDLLVTTATLLAYRLRPGLPKSQYGITPEPQNVALRPAMDEATCGYPAILVDNPKGALINVHVALTDTQGRKRIVGSLSSRSAFEIPVPNGVAAKGEWMVHATAANAAGKLLEEKSWPFPPRMQTLLLSTVTNGLDAWGTSPFASFQEKNMPLCIREAKSGTKVTLESLYLDEADQAAFIVISTRDQPTRARVTLSRLARTDGLPFGGTTVLREVVATGSVNGEKVPDALPSLGDGGLVNIPAQRAVRIWISVDTHGAQPGNYTGHVAIASLDADVKKLELPVEMEVLNLRLPKEFPLTLCTWDYVPNRWFSARSKEVLDDMSRHGVNVFPRTIIPPGRVDATDKLTIDWTLLDGELDRLDHRGRILFHLSHPPIEFTSQKSEADKRPVELEYLRDLRDHLRQRGRSYVDYAFYLLDEPGLDYGTNIPVLLDAGKLFREADPKLQTYTDPVPGLSWKDFESIEPLVDVWAPNMRLVSGLLSGDPRIKRIMHTKTVWSYECVSQVKSLSPLRYNRANAWRAKFFGLSGIGFWTHSTTEVDHWFAGKTMNDEYALVYPGELPVPSVRWEAVRDGLEDLAAIVLLEQTIQRHRQSATKREIVQQAEEYLRIAQRDIVELSDEAFVESRDFLREGDRVLGHTWTDVETFRRHRAEIARLTLALSEE